MIITNENLKNPYILAFCKANNIKKGDTIKTIDYMFWIDKKHDDFRRLKGLPEHIDLNKSEVKEFCAFIGLN